jgi:hypothetical protein
MCASYRKSRHVTRRGRKKAGAHDEVSARLNEKPRLRLALLRDFLVDHFGQRSRGGAPFGFGGGAAVGSPSEVLISSSDLPCAAMVLILLYLSSMNASFFCTSALVIISPWPVR